MRTLNRMLLACFAVPAAACSSEAGPPDPNQQREDGIVYGQLDPNTDAVIAVYDSLGSGICSGTIIDRKAQSGYVLTAAHCVTADGQTTIDPSDLYIIAGDDYATSSEFYAVVEVAMHPLYDGTSGSAHDFAMVRYIGAPASTPTLPPLLPSQDNLAVGTQLDLVGLGRTHNDLENSARHHVVRPIANLNNSWLTFTQSGSSGGVCSGDSGGPALTADRRVAGVASFNVNGCYGTGVHGRVSRVVDSFIQPFLDGTTGVLSCDECFTASITGTGACVPAVEACFGGTNPDCEAFYDCIVACQDDACEQQCFTDHAAGADTYLAIYDCVCETGCVSECVNEPMCAKPVCGFTFSDATCGGCSDTSCCAAEQACADDATCTECMTSANPPASCATNTLANAWNDCLVDNCATACGIEVPVCGFTFSDATCGGCSDTSCCVEEQACADDTTCTECMTSANPPASCASNTIANAWNDCLIDNCATACGIEVPVCGFTFSDATCGQCSDTSCCVEEQACADDTTCTECMTSADPPASCATNTIANAWNDCLVGNCATPCGIEVPICGFTFTDATCGECSDNSCCVEEQACADDAACTECMTSSNPPASCATNTLANAWNDCLVDNCAAACGIEVPICGFTFTDPTCGGCSDDSCCAEEQACADDAACTECMTSSSPPASCANDSLVNAWDACLTSNCSTECGMGAACGFTHPDATCQSCFEGACCDEALACSEDATCTECLTTDPPPDDCDTNTLANGFVDCMSDHCGTECGTGGAGGSGGAAGAAGSAGSAGSGGTSGTGGSAGSGGGGGTSGTGGGAGSGASGGSGGFGGSVGGAGGSDAGVGGTSGSATNLGDSTEGGGCSCSTPNTNRNPWAAAMGLSVLAGIVLSRRRNRK